MTEEELKQQEETLKAMESDLKTEATNLDKKKAELVSWSEDLDKREENVHKKLKLGGSGEAFEKLTSLITELYTTYVGIRGNDEGLNETINSILDARKKLQG